jgi:TolB-like protein/DNA-binding winged helix-turn-helix (wHTH) protein/tetratricopeptide (TPR) repeat protein
VANNLRQRVCFGVFDFSVESGELRRDGTPVKLAPQPTRVLALLLSRPGEVVGRDEFRRELWGDDTFVDFERGLNFCITQVRSALGDASENPRFVQTVPKRGYRFIAPVSRPVPEIGDRPSFGGLSPTLPSPPPSPATTRGRRPSRRRTWWTAAAVVALAIVGWWVWGGRPAPGPARAQASAVPARVAVLPFANMTGDAGADYVADGLTDEVITQLGTLTRDRVAVIARTSVMTYRDSRKSVAEIGRELDVQYVVEGSIRRNGSALRVNGSLVAVSDQSAVARWEETFDSSAATPQQHETHASIRIARRAALELLPSLDAPVGRAATADAALWNDFLAASALLNRGTPEEVQRAIQQLDGIVQREGRFAAAWAKLAEARHLLVMMGAMPPADAYPAAQRAAQHAVQADANLPSAHLAQGLVELWYNWRPGAAAAAFERALALNPSHAAAHHDYAWALLALGRTDAAIRHITRARDLDPLSTRANNDIGWLYLHARRPEDAVRACQHTLAIDARALEAQACLERAYTQQQLFDAALQAARATLRPSDDIASSTSGAEALREIWTGRLRQLERASASRWVSPYILAVHYALTHDTARALDALDQAYASRVGMMAFVAHDPAMDSLRSHPRFIALLQKINGTS